MAIKKPPFVKGKVDNFGLPRGNFGRGAQTPQVIVLHCSKNTEVETDAIACRDFTIKGVTKPEEVSYHFTVSNSGIREYVDVADISWAWSDLLGQPINFFNYDWTAITARPGVPPYLYAIDIGILENSTDERCQSCELPIATNEVGYQSLVRLLAYISFQYGIPLNINTVAFHNRIDALAEGECRCFDLDKLLADAIAYEDPCDNQPLPAEIVTQVQYLYGEEPDKGCFSKITVCAAMTSTFAPSATRLNSGSVVFAEGCIRARLPVYSLSITGGTLNLIENGVIIDSESVCSLVVSCETPFNGIAGNAISIIPGGVNGHSPRFNINVSGPQAAGPNQIQVIGNALYVAPNPAPSVQTNPCIVPANIMAENNTLVPLGAIRSGMNGGGVRRAFASFVPLAAYSAPVTPINSLSETITNSDPCRTLNWSMIIKTARLGVLSSNKLNGQAWSFFTTVISPNGSFPGSAHGRVYAGSVADPDTYDLSADSWIDGGTLAPGATATFSYASEMRNTNVPGGQVQCLIGRELMVISYWYD